MHTYAYRLMRIRKSTEHKSLPTDCRRAYAGTTEFSSFLEAAAVCSTVKQAIRLGKLSTPERNLAAKIGYRQDSVDEGLAILILTDNGLIQHCNQRVGELLGRQPSSLIWEPVSAVLPQLAEMTLISNDQINPRLRFLARIGHRFEVVGSHGIHLKCELFFIHKEYRGHHYLQVIIRPVDTVAYHLQ